MKVEPAIQSKLWAETVLSAKVRKHPFVKARQFVAIALKRLVLIWMNRASYVTYCPAEGTSEGAAWPLSGVTVTLKSTPASAELLEMPVELWFLELIVTSVRRPMTAEGRITNTLPLPLLVFRPAFALPMQVPDDAGSWHVPVLVPPVGLLQVAPELLP